MNGANSDLVGPSNSSYNQMNDISPNQDLEDKINQSRIVGSHRYQNRKPNSVLHSGSQLMTDTSSLFLDTPQNNIINQKKENNSTERHSWSGFDSFNLDFVEHTEAEGTYHRHSWSGW